MVWSIYFSHLQFVRRVIAVVQFVKVPFGFHDELHFITQDAISMTWKALGYHSLDIDIQYPMTVLLI